MWCWVEVNIKECVHCSSCCNLIRGFKESSNIKEESKLKIEQQLKFDLASMEGTKFIDFHHFIGRIFQIKVRFLFSLFCMETIRKQKAINQEMRSNIYHPDIEYVQAYQLPSVLKLVSILLYFTSQLC